MPLRQPFLHPRDLAGRHGMRNHQPECLQQKQHQEKKGGELRLAKTLAGEDCRHLAERVFYHGGAKIEEFLCPKKASRNRNHLSRRSRPLRREKNRWAKKFFLGLMACAPDGGSRFMFSSAPWCCLCLAPWCVTCFTCRAVCFALAWFWRVKLSCCWPP